MEFKTRIVIVEDNKAVKDGYELIINANSKYAVVKTYLRAEDAIRHLRRDRPDIMFMDLDLPGMDGITGIRKIRKIEPRVQIIVITVFEDSTMVFDALCAGAAGYIIKSANHRELIEAIEEINERGGAPMSPQIARMVVGSFQRNPNSPLSPRETEILASLASGKTYKDTAEELNIGMETVKSHVKNIYGKLHASCKTEAIKIAKEHSLI